jgi:RNase P protein component
MNEKRIKQIEKRIRRLIRQIVQSERSNKEQSFQSINSLKKTLSFLSYSDLEPTITIIFLKTILKEESFAFNAVIIFLFFLFLVAFYCIL